MPSTCPSIMLPESFISSLAVAAPVVVTLAPRLRCSAADKEQLCQMLSALWQVNPITFRVSGMAFGPEHDIEELAGNWGHFIEVYGEEGRTEHGFVRRLFKRDEMPAAALDGAHALWLWLLPSDLAPDRSYIEDPVAVMAKELGVPVFLVLPESCGFEVLELP